MRDEPLTLPGEEHGGFRKNFLLVLAAHVAFIALAWVGGRWLFKPHKPEQITWLDGGGELGSAAALPLPESGDTRPPVKLPQPDGDILPPLPQLTPEPVTPKATDDLALFPKATPTPTPRPRPTATPAPKPTATPRPKPAVPKPSPEPTAKPKPKPVASAASPTPAKTVAKIATPSAGTKPADPKITDSNAKPQGAGTGTGNAKSGTGNATNAGTKGGPGAAGGTTAALQTYFSKVEPVIHREWKPPQTVVSSSREVEAHVRLRVAADGTVESLKLVKPTGNVEVDKSIEDALQRVKKLERPPAELLKNGVLEASVEFVLEI